MNEGISVAIYLVDRCYGGPEEGGWYYTCGVPAEDLSRFTRGFRAKDELKAQAYSRRLDRHLCRHLNVGRRPIGSVLSAGVYEAVVCDGNPKRFPEKRPRYE